MARIDSAVISLLNLDPTLTTISSLHGGTSSASTFKLTTGDDVRTSYFLKTAANEEAKEMFAGEFASLTALSDAVPAICPRPFGYGRLLDSAEEKYFLITEFIESSPPPRSSQPASSSKKPLTIRDAVRDGDRSNPSIAHQEKWKVHPKSLVQKLAALHSIPAPIPSGYSSPQFGFPVPTYCGNTPQNHDYSSSWSQFYGLKLKSIVRQARLKQGESEEMKEIESWIGDVANRVCPVLLGKRLSEGEDVMPVLVHGDLWSGNYMMGYLPSSKSQHQSSEAEAEVEAEAEAILFDASSFYGCSEYDLGIMKMFGGFSSSFYNEYHSYIPKMTPVDEYEDRIRLYQLFHQLNHFAMFGGTGYANAAIQIMDRLITRYS